MSNPDSDKRMRRRMPLLYAVIGACVLITALSINAQAGNLLQLNFGNDTVIYFNDTESQINGTLLVNGSPVCTIASGCGGGVDLNNYTTSTSFTGNVLSTARLGMSTLTATIPNNAITIACQNITGAASDLCTISNTSTSSGNITFYNDTGINITGNTTNITIGISNLLACNPNTEYSVWNGSNWLCDNDGTGNTYDTGNGLQNNANIFSINATTSGTGNYSYWNGTAWLTATDQNSGGNTSGNLVSGEGVYAYNNTQLTTNKILYVEPNNGSDIQTKINQCPTTGCTVVIPSGTYNISTGIIVNKSYIRIIGGGLGTTINQNSGSNLDYIFKFYNSDYSGIESLFIDGKRSSQSSGQGVSIDVNSSVRFIARDIWIQSSYGSAMRFAGTNIKSAHASQITDIKIYDSGNIGIQLEPYSYDTEFVNIWIGLPQSYGVYVGASEMFFTNLHVWGGSSDGVYVRGGFNRFNNCYIETNANDGFDMFTSSYNTISVCNIMGNGERGIQMQSSIYNVITNSIIRQNNGSTQLLAQDANYSIISNNVFDGRNRTGSSGVELSGAAKMNSVTGNQFWNLDYGINSSTGTGYNSIIQNNYETNNGTAFIAAGNNLQISNYTLYYYINNSLFFTLNNNRTGIGTGVPNSTLDVVGNASFTGNLATFAGLFSNGSQVCTAANGLCGGSGNTSSNLNINYIPYWDGTLLLNSEITRNTTHTNINNNVTINGTTNITGNLSIGTGIWGDGPNPSIILSTASGSVLRYGTTNFLVGSGTIRHTASGTELARLTTKGYGFNTTTPLNTVEVNGTFKVENTSGNFGLYSNGSHTGIGTGNPNSTLDVVGNASFTGNLATFAGLFSNNSQVCTAANGLCGAGSGNSTTEMRDAVNNTGPFNISVPWDNITGKPTLTITNYTANFTCAAGTAVQSGAFNKDGTQNTTTCVSVGGGSGLSSFNATNGSTIINSTTNAVVNITAGNNINVAVNSEGTFNVSQLTLPQSVLLFDEWVDPYYGGTNEDGEAGMMGWNVVVGGTGATVSFTSAQREPGRMGIMNMTTGSTNGGNVTVHLSPNMIYFNATSGKVIQFGGFNIGTTSGANNITYLMGFGDQTASTAAAQNDTDAIWIAYNASGGHNNFSLITRQSGVQSENVTDVTVTPEQFYDYQIVVYNNTRVELYIENELKATLNTNIPTGNTRLLGPMQKLRKLGTTAGTAPVMVGVDYYGIRYEFGVKK